MKKNLFLVPSLALLTAMAVIFTSCNKPSPFTPTGPENVSQVTSNTHGHGCNLLPKDQYNKIPLAKASTVTLMAAATVLTLDCPPVGNQGQQGSCTAWGTTYSARSISWHNRMGGTWSTAINIFSPAYVYNQTKATSDCNAGAYTTSALDLLKSQGVCRWNLMTYTDQNCSTMPSATQKADAANFKILSYSRVGLTADSIKSFLVASKPVIVAGPVNNAFESLGNGAVLTSFSGSNLGGHCYCVVGYDDNKQAFKFLNSWGPNWATAGYGYISYNYIKSWWQEAYVVNDISVSLPGQASSPSPTNGATGVSTAPTLSWTAGSSATSHDVYFGTSNPPSLKGNQSATTYTPGTLPTNTTYYWRIDEKNSTGTTTGTVWSFTTGSGTITQYTITASAGSNGSISPSGSVKVNSGASQAFTITPNSGYQVDVVTVDGTSQGSITSYTFNNVTAIHTISVTFKTVSFPDPTKWYKIATKANPNQCLDVTGGNYANSTAIELWGKINVNQEFQFKDAGSGYYTITCRGNTSYSIDMSGNFSNGQTLKLWTTQTTNANQKFKLVLITGGYYRIETSNSGFSIDNTGNTSNGVKPWLWASDNNNANQQWVITVVP